MKKLLPLIGVLVFIFTGVTANANGNSPLRGNGLMFTENKGQIVDTKQQLRPDILFKAKDGTEIYIRKTGISYVLSNFSELQKQATEQLEAAKKTSGQQDQKNWKDLLNGKNISSQRIDMDFINSDPNAEVQKTDQAEGYENYYYAHCKQGITHVNSWNEITQKNIYPDIDVKYYGDKSKGLKYDLVVNPGGNPSQIKLEYKGADYVHLERGHLFIGTMHGEMEEFMPKVYQNVNGKTVDVKAEYSLKYEVSSPEQHSALASKDSRLTTQDYIVTFQLGTYNPELPLIIDPWASYFSAGGDAALSVNTDQLGNPVFTGESPSSAFPVTPGAYQTVYGSGAYSSDAVVAKMTSAGARVWATYFGGSSNDSGSGIVCDASNNVLVTGRTTSLDIPTYAAAGYTSYESSSSVQPSAFLLKFDPTGACLFATYYSGSSGSAGSDVATDGTNIYLYGQTYSTTGISTAGTAQPVFGGGQDAFVAKFNSNGNLTWGTYIGGTGFEYSTGISCDAAGNVYVNGATSSHDFPVQAGSFQTTFGGGFFDVFLCELNSSGGMVMSTYYGGSGDENALAIATDKLGNVMMDGTTNSAAGIASAGGYVSTIGTSGQDAFLVQFKGNSRNWGTYLGGNPGATVTGLAVDALNNIYVQGEWEDLDPSGSYPASACAYQTTFGGVEDQFVEKYTSAGQRTCMTFRGGPGEDDMEANNFGGYGGSMAVYGNALYIVGGSGGSYPVTPGVFQTTWAGTPAYYFFDIYVDQLCTNICEAQTTGLDFSANTTTVCNNTPVAYTPTVAHICDTTGYRFQWIFTGGNPSTSTATNPSVTYYSAGNYTVKLKLSTICKNDSVTKVSYITVNNCSSSPTVTAAGNTICAGSCAAVTSSPASGTSPYTYLWSTGATTQNISDCPLSTKTYTLTITDAAAGTATSTATIVVNPVVSVTAAPTNINCFGGTGSAIANGSAGTSPYTYSWNNTLTTQTITNLSVGNYTVTITDSKGCTSTSTTSITQPIAISLSASQKTPASCGSNNGVALATAASGGNGGFSYLWNSGATGLTASTLASGTYTVTATDSKGCTQTATAVIGNSPAPVISGIAPTQLLCNGASTASAVVSATGTGTLTYTWTNGNTAVTSTNLSAGTYYVTVTDANGCNAISSVVITAPSAIATPAITPVNATCGNSNGSAVASSSGGTGLLTYTWNNVVSGQTNSGLAAGGYTVTVKDANGCTVTSVVTINNSGGPSVTSVNITNPLCSTGSGTAVASASGGAGTLTYTWNNTVSGATATGLATGIYTVTVKDANGCANTSAVSIVVPSAISLSASQNIPASCGNNNGEAITTAASGGTGTFSYLWSNGSTGLTASSLTSGTYSVTATDADGCTASSAAIVNNNPAPVINSISSTPLLCNAASTASAVVSATGTSTLTYSWTNGSTSVTSSSLSAGTYYVTVTDGSGCNVISSTVITSPAAISINPITSTNASCGSSNGSAVASASGGTGTLTYSWSTSGGATGQTASGLASGPYTVTVTDANACVMTSSIAIGNNNGPLVQTTTPVNELCNGNSTGSAALTISGGSSPYTYSWSNGTSSITNSLNNSITSLPANTYVVTVTDKNGCSTTASFNITEPAAISTPVITPTNASCGASDGSAVASSSGGTGSLIYSWSNLAGGQTASALSSATYTVSVTDANACIITNTVAIGNNGGPSVQTTTPVNELCNGSSTGSAAVSISGGAAPYTYSWSNAVSSITTSLNNSITSLPAGSYIVTISDNNSCTTTTSINVTEPTAITIPSTSASNSTCGNANGSANAISSGGTGILTYSWSSGAAGQTAINLLVQTYTVSVTDANNCTVTKTVTIGNDNAPVVSLNVTSAISCNAGTGSITATATGGNPNYTYSWSTGGTNFVTASLNHLISSLTANTYTVTITDVSGCSHTSSILLTEPSAVVINSVAPVNSNCGTATGSAVASASGGTGSLTYSWNNFASGQTNSSLAANTYTVTVTDANACKTSQTVTINNNGGPVISSVTSMDELCHGASTGSASVNISGGASPYTYAWSPGATQITTNTQSTINNQQSGNYSVTIIDANGCQIVSTVTITEPVALTIASVSQINATCGQSNGSAKATVTGGTGLYTYSWSNGVSSVTSFTSTTINFVSSGSYTLLITDANGCTTSQSVPVSNNPAPTINGVTSSPVLCNGGNNGSAIVSATGTSALTYSWSSGSTTTTATGLSAAIYTVTVTDASGCQQLSVVTIAQPTAITVTNINTTSSSCNKNDGTAVATASGGAPVLTYTWSSGSTTATANNLAAGNYVLTVTDANGCVITNTVTINSTSGPTAVASVGTSIKCNGQTGSIIAAASNGTLPYTYSWSTGATSVTTATQSTVNNQQSGIYTVTITDKNGCTSTSSVTLSEPPALIAASTKTDASCGNADGNVSVTITGGTPDYTYSWSTGISSVTSSLSNSITSLNSGTFAVTVTDANGCIQNTVETISNSNAPVAGTASSQTTITEGNSTILIGSSTGTGVTYTWTPGASLNCSDCLTPTANPGTTTTYTLYVKDNMGCVDSSMITITVKKACTSDEDIYIANIFSPNNDGKNDVLNIEGNAITNIYWAIYDRWGNLLFETTDQAQGWDGTKNGNPMETGTYVYYLKAVCKKTNAEVKLKGNVSIVK